MAAKNFSVSQDDHGIYHLHGELSIHELDDLRGFLERFLEEEQETAISLAKVRFIDTAALQLFIAFKKQFQPDAKLRISDISSEVEKILSLCGLKTALL
jgi:anti-anti-sigma factor